MSASDRAKLFADWESAVEEEDAAAKAMNDANQRYNAARDAATSALAAMNGMVSQASDAAVHGQLDPPAEPPSTPAPAPAPVPDSGTAQTQTA